MIRFLAVFILSAFAEPGFASIGPCESDVLIERANLIFEKHDGQNTKDVLTGLIAHLKTYKIGPIDEEEDPLFDAMLKVEKQFRPVFKKQMESLNWTFTEEEKIGLHHFVVPRAEIVKKYPILSPLLPEDASYSFAPSYQIPWRADAVYSSLDLRIILPLTLLFNEPDFITAQSIVHEAVHHYLELMRRQTGIRSFAFTVIPGKEAFEFLSTRINPYYAAQFSSEELFAYLVNALNAFDMECAGVELGPKANFRAHFMNSWPPLVTYLGTILPQILKHQTDGYFIEDKSGLFFVNADDSYRVCLQLPADGLAVLSSDEIRREMNRAYIQETEILLGLHEVYQRFVKITGGRVDRKYCTASHPLWDYLEKVGFPKSQFRILRR